MSRAVQRKRKRLSKQQVDLLEQNQSFHIDDKLEFNDSSCIEEQTDTPNNFSFSNIDEYIPATDIDKDIYNYDLNDIINLEDNEDIDVVQKSSFLLQKIIHSITIKEFYSNYNSRLPFKCIRDNSLFFKKYFTKKTLEVITSKQLLYSNINIDFHSNFKNNQDDDDDEKNDISDKIEINSKAIWYKYNHGYSIILLTPQVYHDKTWKLLSLLEHQFDCRVGAMIYLSPPLSLSSQLKGNANMNHYESDDENDKNIKNKQIYVSYDHFDSFILQLEGISHWRITQNPNQDKILPLDSNKSMLVSDVNNWEDVMIDTNLYPGDTLYIPKGWVYQMENLSESHSLYIKIYFNESSSVADLLNLAVPQALAVAIDSDLRLRQSLPRQFNKYIGISASEKENDKERNDIQKYFEKLMNVVSNKTIEVLDAATEQLRKQFIGQRLPVPISSIEETRSAAGAPRATIYPYTQLRMIRPGIAIAAVEDGKVVVYHCMDNARQLYGATLQPLEFELDDGPAIEMILSAYPNSVTISDLDHPSEELDDKIGVAEALYKEGFLLITDEASNPSDKPIGKHKTNHKFNNKINKHNSSDFNNSVNAANANNDDDPF